MNYFITLEGIEGCGKSTQIQRLRSWLQEQGQQVTVTREPGGSPVAEAIRSILLHPEHDHLCPESELLLYCAARAQHLRDTILPALNQGQWVLCDRFLDATSVYQGHVRGIDPNWLNSLHQFCCHGKLPDLTLVLDMDAQQALSRARQRNCHNQKAEGRFEAQDLAFHQQVRQGYQQLAQQHPHRLSLVSAAGSPEEVTQRLQAVLAPWVTPV